MIEERALIDVVPIQRIPEWNQTVLVTVAVVFSVLAWITVVLRLYTRTFVNRSFGQDDAMIIVALLFYTLQCVTTSIATHLVNAKDSLPAHLMTIAINVLLVAEDFYILSMMTLKISLAIFFLRLVVEPWQRRTIYSVIVITTVFGIAYFLYATFQCGIPHGLSFWEKRLLGKCAGSASILGMGYTHGILSALTDVVFVILMIPVVMRVKVQSYERIVLGGIFFLATIGCTASFARLAWIRALTSTGLDFFANLFWLVIWSMVEAGLGITAVSLATLRPFLRRIVAPGSFIRRHFYQAETPKRTSGTNYREEPNRLHPLQNAIPWSTHTTTPDTTKMMPIQPVRAYATRQPHRFQKTWYTTSTEFGDADS